jgi:hypothetical protein
MMTQAFAGQKLKALEKRHQADLEKAKSFKVKQVEYSKITLENGDIYMG